MAEISGRLIFNREGKYYVDGNCICCGICTEIAPDIFQVNLVKEVGFVARQPETEADINAVLKAVATCPVNAIGDDGDRSQISV